MNEIWSYDYRLKTCLMMVFIFCKYNKIRVSADRPSYAWLFHLFCSKIHFDGFILENFVVLYKNEKIHLIFCNKNRGTAIFTLLRSKLTYEMCQKVWSLEGKVIQIRRKTCISSFYFSLNTATFKEKWEMLFYFLV